MSALIVELDRLPLEKGTSGLHTMRLPSDDESAKEVLDLFVSDDTIPFAVRRTIEDMIMNQTLATTDFEMSRTRELSEERGRREALIEVVAATRGAEIAATLSHVDDLAELQRRVVALLRDE